MANLDKDYYLDEQGLQTLINELETNLVALEYSASATYAVGDYCVHDNKMYRCTTAITTAESWDSTHWSLVIIGDELKTKKSGTVTSVTIKGTSPIVSSSSSAITTSGTRTISHADSGVTAGTYKSVTVNATGHVTAGSNPTTLSGYGITDAKIESGTITLGSDTITPITSHQTVTDNNPTLDWGTQSTVATIGSTDIHVNLPANPNTDTKVRQTLIATNYDRPLLMSAVQTSSTTTNTDNVVYRNNSIYANPSTGRITTKNLTVGISADNATFPDGAVRCYDVRNVTGVPTTEGVNFIMTNEGSPINTDWYSGLYVKSSGGEYGVWELVGPALNADNRTKPLYVRSSNKTTAWGDWRKIYDSSNPPTASDVGALPSTTTYAGSSTVGGSATSAVKLDTATAGSATQPCYFTDGQPSACTYSLNKTVPSNAVFTDTKVTAVGNHYTPSGGSSKTPTGDTDTDITNLASGSGSQVISGVTIDAAGHITGLTSKKIRSVNTTYTFANGTNGFTVTPSGGTAQTVTVTPSITNNITGSGTSGYLTKFNGTNTITNGPQLGSSTTTYLRNDGTWATPTDTKVTQTVLSSTATNWRKVVLGYSGSSSEGASASDVTNITYVDNALEYKPDTGTLKTTIFSATDGINAHTSTDSTTGGIALWNNNPALYGITMRTTGTATGELGKHGYVQGDYAVYFCMNSTTGSATQQRGWVLRHHRLSDNVASVDINGNAVFNGSVTVGGNDTNTSGCRLTYNSTTKSCDFVFA